MPSSAIRKKSDGTAVLMTPSLSSVFDKLVGDIVSGHYAPGAHLPAERELSRQLGASRPTLREALRRLSEWRLVEARRGSGITVRPISDWSFDVLPAYLKHGLTSSPAAVGQLIGDLLTVRRILFVSVLEIVGPRLTGGAQLGPAREALERAWAARADTPTFVRHDFEVLRSLVHAARFLPALWILGDLARVYLEIAGTVVDPDAVPSDYHASYTKALDAIAAGDVAKATKQMQHYLERHDQLLLSRWGLA